MFATMKGRKCHGDSGSHLEANTFCHASGKHISWCVAEPKLSITIVYVTCRWTRSMPDDVKSALISHDKDG